MATKTKPVVEETEEEKERNPLFESSRRVLLAGIGAFALAQDEIEEFVNKLVERGEIAEKDGKKLVREVMEKRKKTSKSAEGEMNKRVQEVLDHLNVPTKSDIESLGEKIAALTKKVDELKKTQA
jgi:polyhydroxyalkanoate synthesis regulator phasin